MQSRIFGLCCPACRDDAAQDQVRTVALYRIHFLDGAHRIQEVEEREFADDKSAVESGVAAGTRRGWDGVEIWQAAQLVLRKKVTGLDSA